jgi:hypothetical protein
MISAEGRFDAAPDLSQLYQGDVVRDIPFPKWPTFNAANEQTKWGILRPMNQGERTLEESLRTLPNSLIGRAAKDVPDAFRHSKKELVIASCELSIVMIVSRSCSLDNPARKHYLVAPVTTVESLPTDQRSEEKLAALRNGEIPHFFYFPGRESLSECFADLYKITAIHRSFFSSENLARSLAARLSSKAMMELQHTLALHFGLQFGFDHQDICKQDGNYRCANCFHLGFQVEIRHVIEGSPFGPCDHCGEEAAFVKLPAS